MKTNKDILNYLHTRLTLLGYTVDENDGEMFMVEDTKATKSIKEALMLVVEEVEKINDIWETDYSLHISISTTYMFGLSVHGEYTRWVS